MNMSNYEHVSEQVKTLLTRIFIADADGGGFNEDEPGYYDQTEVCRLVGELRSYLEAMGQFDWKRDAEPLLGQTSALDELQMTIEFAPRELEEENQ